MQRKDGEKPHYSFTAGLVTEQSPVNVVEGSALAIENLEINRDGSLRRRRAIKPEAGLSLLSTAEAFEEDEAYCTYTWRSAGGDPSRTVIVIQIGSNLYFFDDGENVTSGLIGSVPLGPYITATATFDQLRQSIVSIADGRGNLFVVGRHNEPIYITLLGNSLGATKINLRMRDFNGVEDGLPWTYKPSLLTDSHKYNLANRGWSQDYYNQFLTDIGVLPGKNMIPYAGLAREVDVAVQEGFGTNVWNSAKLANEFFGDSSAPTGRLFLDPFDTTSSQSTGGDDTAIPTSQISTWEWTGSTVTVTTVTPHGLTDGTTITIVGNQFTYTFTPVRPPVPVVITGSFDGAQTVTVVNPTVFTFTRAPLDPFNSWVNKYLTLGVVQGTGSDTPILIRDGGYTTYERPQAVAFWAGRVWYAGTSHTALADVVFFSQIVETPSQYGLCYQSNDPTAQNFNTVLDSDGGTIKIPGLHGILGAWVLGGSLILYCTSGIWEITGGQGGFSALDYRVRKINDAECVSKMGTCKVDSSHIVATKRGLYAVGYDTNSGYVSAQNISASRINTLWNDIPDAVKARMVLGYDDAKKRVYISYGDAGTPVKLRHSLVLALDVGENGAFYTLTLPKKDEGFGFAWTLGQFVIDAGDNANRSKKMKWIVVDGANTGLASICDMDHTDFTDITTDQDIPYVTFAHDNTEDWTKRKYVSQYLFCFMKKTETGYAWNGQEFEPIGQSSMKMQGRWEWADHINSGKYSQPVEIYRHRREYTPTGELDNFNDGSPVIVTRNKLRGSGRALQLHFEGALNKDAHLLGYVIEYGVARN